MASILSGKVKKIPATAVSADRYNFLKLSEAEPDLGVPTLAGYVLSSDTAGNRIWISGSTIAAPFNVLNDISNQFDGYKSVFNLLQDQTNITTSSISSSINVEVILNGKKLTPYIKQISFPWINTYESQKGYRVVVTSTNAVVTIYNTPDPGDQATLTIINNITTVPATKYPYSATTLALGD